MLKAYPIQFTKHTEKYKEFLNSPFNINMLCSVEAENPCVVLFDGWSGEKMRNSNKFIYADFVVEFYPTYYTFQYNMTNSIRYMLAIPKTISDFIYDMFLFGIQLHWSNWITEKLLPEDYEAMDETTKNQYEEVFEANTIGMDKNQNMKSVMDLL